MNDKLKVKFHDLGKGKCTLEIQSGISAKRIFINLTQDQLADLSYSLTQHLDRDACCGDVCDFS